MKTYLVIAVYSEDYQRFADSYEAETPEDAETQCNNDVPGLIIAGVIDMATCKVVL